MAEPIVDPGTKKVIFKRNELIDREKLAVIMDKKIDRVVVRSPLSCNTEYGVCVRCYGWDLSNRQEVVVGTPVGVIAAQSIGEPGTQLTLRTHHTGGVIGLDVTQGLPRVQELLEIRMPKTFSPLSDVDGKVSIKKTNEGWQLKITGKKGKTSTVSEYLIPLSNQLLVKDGEKVLKGTQLASGSLDIREIARIQGVEKAQKYLLDEIQKVYESQGIAIHDKHFEVIIREMGGKIRIESSGDTSFLVGGHVDEPVFIKENKQVKKEKGKPARGEKVILGITQVALNTSSWLSAASFQETTNVLTEASILGREDRLIGLKENVIIGRLIPVDSKRARME